jgi:hypothetical protein
MVQSSNVGLISNAFALLVVGFIYAFFTDRNIPVVNGPKQAVMVLFVMGLAMSMLAGIRDNADPTFFESMPPPVRNSLMVLGVLSVVVIAVVLSGVNVPGLSDYRQSFKVLGGIIGLKLVILRGYLLLLAFR